LPPASFSGLPAVRCPAFFFPSVPPGLSGLLLLCPFDSPGLSGPLLLGLPVLRPAVVHWGFVSGKAYQESIKKGKHQIAHVFFGGFFVSSEGFFKKGTSLFDSSMPGARLCRALIFRAWKGRRHPIRPAGGTQTPCISGEKIRQTPFPLIPDIRWD